MTKQLALSQGKFALVDDDDFLKLGQFKYQYRKSLRTGYAIRRIGPRQEDRKVFLHQEIMGVSSPTKVDHINGDGLDNRKENLRICTAGQNQYNQRRRLSAKTKYRGVSLRPGLHKWRARIRVNNKEIHIGDFDDEITAARKRDEYAKLYHGAFAQLNFPLSEESPSPID